MKKIFNIIICATFALFSAACNQVEEIEMGAGEGVLTLNINFASTRAEFDPATMPFELKIYRYTTADKSEKELVRKYTNYQDVPQYIWLLEDSYVAQVKVGEKELASFDKQYYFGSEDFAIVPQEENAVNVDCKLYNIPVRVNYDETVAKHFTADFYTYVCATNSFNIADAESGEVPTLKYTESKTGFFILPDGTTDLCWYFYGSNGTDETVRQSAIKGIEADKYYTLSFKYSKDAPGGLVITAKIDYTVDIRDDKVPFSPDPTVKAVGFNIENPIYYNGGNYQYNVAALGDIKTLTITRGEETLDLLGDTAIAGVAVEMTNKKSYTVTLSEQFFAGFTGGLNTFVFRIKDSENGNGYQECSCYIEGIVPVAAYDPWAGTKVSACSFGGENISLGHRTTGGEWSYVALSATADNNIYKTPATFWFAAGGTSEYALFVDGVQVGLSQNVTVPVGNQIPNAGFEQWSTDSSDKAVCPAADPSNLYWDTGNHATADLTGKQLTVSDTDVRSGATGTKSAYMQSIKATVFGVGAFAAGNLFVGDFGEIAGMGGIVEFGRDFDFNVRPKAIRFWVKNNEGTINEGSHTTGTDLAKVYCCFSDRKYIVNTNNSETFFVPSIETNGVLASAVWETHESHSEWTLIEIPITYRDNLTTKPTQLVLTFTCSGYGDYFTGSTDSWMKVDDVEFVY